MYKFIQASARPHAQDTSDPCFRELSPIKSARLTPGFAVVLRKAIT